VRPIRLATWFIGSAYVLLGVLCAVVYSVLQSREIDIGGVTLSVLVLGIGGTVLALALLAGSLIGAYALTSDAGARRMRDVAIVLAGWVGAAVVGWFAWVFWRP
jgi:hypothetical protein